MRRGRPVHSALIALLVLTALALYAWQLDRVPANLHDAEVQFGLHARAIALTGHDATGHFMPVYFYMPAIGDNVWFHPVLVYWTAPFLWVLPFSEWSVRFPTAVLGTLNVWLIYVVAARLFQSRSIALLAAATLALTPAHFLHGRVAMDYLHPVPFILAWLWCLLRFESDRKWGFVYAGAAVLGVGVYSYIASIVMMPLYLAATLAYAWWRHDLSPRRAVAMVGCFLAPLTAAVYWFGQNPGALQQTAMRYAMGHADAGWLTRLRWYLNYNAIQDQLSIYFDFFNPAYLFLAGGTDLMNSTRMAGVLLFATAPLLAVGLVQACRGQWNPINLLLVFGFVTAPIAATFVRGSRATDRELGILPFAVLLSVMGFIAMRQDSRRWVRTLAIGLVIAIPAQFAFFHSDYLGDYRIRSAGAFESNLRGAVDEMVRLAPGVPRFYVSTTLPYGRDYWRFAQAKAGVEGLETLTSPLTPSSLDLSAVPPASLILGHASDVALRDASRSGQLRLVYEAPEFGTDTVFFVYHRPGPE